MIISRNQIGQVVSAYLQKSQGTSGTAALSNGEMGRAGGVASQDQLALSEKAREIKTLTAYVQRLPEIRRLRVEQLRAQINSNRYQITGDEIAEKMLGRAIVDRLL